MQGEGEPGDEANCIPLVQVRLFIPYPLTNRFSFSMHNLTSVVALNMTFESLKGHVKIVSKGGGPGDRLGYNYVPTFVFFTGAYLN